MNERKQNKFLLKQQFIKNFVCGRFNRTPSNKMCKMLSLNVNRGVTYCKR